VKRHARSGKVTHTYVITRLGRDEHGRRLFYVVKNDDENGDVEMAIPKMIMAKMMKRCEPQVSQRILASPPNPRMGQFGTVSTLKYPHYVSILCTARLLQAHGNGSWINLYEQGAGGNLTRSELVAPSKEGGGRRLPDRSHGMLRSDGAL
jgi:hypothetical protein